MNLTFLCLRDKIGAVRIAREWNLDDNFLVGRNTDEEVRFYRNFIRDVNENLRTIRNVMALENQSAINSIHHRIACEEFILSANQQPRAEKITP